MQKYTKIQASVQQGLYLFTCEIHSFNSIACIHNTLCTPAGGSAPSRRGTPPWGVLSRVGDRPTAAILQVHFHFFDFCLGFQGKIFNQNMPLLEGINIK